MVNTAVRSSKSFILRQICISKGKGKVFPLQTRSGPEGG